MSITLYAGSKSKNILKSVNDLLVGKLIGQESLSLDWGQPGFKEEGLERWIQARLIFSTGVFMRQVDDSGRKGEIRNFFLNFNLFEIYPPRKNVYWIETLRKIIIEEFYLKIISVYDFDTTNNPLVGEMRINEIMNDRELDNGEDSGLRQWNVNLRAMYLFKYL